MLFVDKLFNQPRVHLPRLIAALALAVAIGFLPTLALATATAPSMGTAQSFAVLAGSTVTNTGPTVVTGDLGVSPGSAIPGFPPGVVTGGLIHAADAVALQAQSDVTTAYNSLAGQACTSNMTGKDLGGLTLTSGVYCFSSSAQLTGNLTLNAQGNSNSVFVFQIGTTLTTASNSSVQVINGGSDCNIFWQVGSSATLGTGTAFIGTTIALTSISLSTNANVSGRTLARNGAVTMDSNNVSVGSCASANATATATLAPATQTALAGVTQTAIATLPPATQTAIARATGTAIATLPPATQTALAGATLTATPVPAGPPASCVGNIRGRKQDGTGRGLAGWTIQLLQSSKVIQTTTTDASGNFNFLGVPTGTYSIQEVQQAGWTPQAPTTIAVSLGSCNQNLTGYTFVNSSGGGTLSPIAAASSATPTRVGTVLLTAVAVTTPSIPSSLPNTGDSSSWSGPLALLVGTVLVAAGIVARRRRG